MPFPVSLDNALPGQALSRRGARVEFVVVPDSHLEIVIDRYQLIRQVQNQVPLVLRTVQSVVHRFKLKCEIIAERAVKSEMVFIRTGEQIDYASQYGENRGLPASLFFREMFFGKMYFAVNTVFDMR